MKAGRIRARYLIETATPLEEAAAMMAGEQSCGTFVRVAGETDALRERHAAVVESIREVGETASPTLSGAEKPKADGRTHAFKRAEVVLAWPFENVGANLPNLLSTLAGNLYELKPFSGLRLLDLELPEEFSDRYPGPQFGIEGTRALTGVRDRPIIGTIIKPNVGLTPEQTAEKVDTLVSSGLDFIKDDEVMGNPPHSPLRERVDRVMKVINRHADKTGRKAMYAFNISGEVDDMLHWHDYVHKAGGSCVMVSLNSVGISGVGELRRHSRLPIHGHRNGFGALSRCPALGIDFMAYQKIWRLAGIDHLHTNGLWNKFTESDEAVIRSIRACLEPFMGGYAILPVLSSAQWAGQAVPTYEAVKSVDLIYLCGGGIIGHPSGARAGVKSVIQGWEAALAGLKLEEYAAAHEELREALDYFGGKR